MRFGILQEFDLSLGGTNRWQGSRPSIDYRGERSRNRFAALHVWNDSHLRRLCEKGRQGRFSRRLHDVERSVESAAHRLQCGTRERTFVDADCFLLSLRDCRRASCSSVFLQKNSDRHFFNFSGFGEPHNHDTDPNIALRFVKNIWRNVRATGPWFLLGIALSAFFQRYVPGEAIGRLFGENEGFGILLAAGAGVPLYVCGGGTIPLLLEWLSNGMSYGSAAAFMLTGPATKITNLGALKTVLGFRNFALYVAFVVLFSLFVGGITNWILF